MIESWGGAFGPCPILGVIMKVLVKVFWAGNHRGDVVEVSDDLGRHAIACGFAEEVKAPLKPAPKKARTAAKDKPKVER